MMSHTLPRRQGTTLERSASTVAHGTRTMRERRRRRATVSRERRGRAARARTACPWHLRFVVKGLVPSLPESPTVLSPDNKAARDLSYNPEHHDRSKHIARRHFFIRDMVEAQEIVVPLVSTDDNDADFFTKPLPPKRFKMLRRKVMNLR
jgi:hypothetical protein